MIVSHIECNKNLKFYNRRKPAMIPTLQYAHNLFDNLRECGEFRKPHIKASYGLVRLQRQMSLYAYTRHNPSTPEITTEVAISQSNEKRIPP